LVRQETYAKPDPFFDLRALIAIGLVINHGAALAEVTQASEGIDRGSMEEDQMVQSVG